MGDMTQSEPPLVMSERFDVWTRSPIKFWNSGFIASTFLKSLSLRTPLREASGASVSSATPRANDPIQPRRELAIDCPSVTQAGFDSRPANPGNNFSTALTPIGSTSTMVDNHSSPLRALLERSEAGLRHFCMTNAPSGADRPARLVV